MYAFVVWEMQGSTVLSSEQQTSHEETLEIVLQSNMSHFCSDDHQFAVYLLSNNVSKLGDTSAMVHLPFAMGFDLNVPEFVEVFVLQ